jgi:hypothetical protein
LLVVGFFVFFKQNTACWGNNMYCRTLSHMMYLFSHHTNFPPIVKSLLTQIFTQGLSLLSETYMSLLLLRWLVIDIPSFTMHHCMQHFWEQKSRMWCKVVSVQIYSAFITGLFWRMCEDTN